MVLLIYIVASINRGHNKRGARLMVTATMGEIEAAKLVGIEVACVFTFLLQFDFSIA